jgi:drug/metabolite transporter (DMT)-like permease
MLAVAVVGISLSAPVTAATAAPALAVAFWRNLGGATATGAWVAARDSKRLRDVDGPLLRAALLAGLLLALHFATWLTGLKMTSVTAATALVCSTPAWVVLADRLAGRTVPRRVVGGVSLALAGALAITGVDAGHSARALTGDLLSLLGAVAAAGYMVAGHRVLERTSTGVYTLLCYGTCAVLMLPTALLLREQLLGFSLTTWVELAVITVGAQLLGHTLLNASMPVIGTTPVALVTLLEVPGAALIAWAWLGQAPPLTVVPGTLLMLAGLVLVVLSRPTPEPDPT